MSAGGGIGGGGFGGAAASGVAGEGTQTGIVWFEASLTAPETITGEAGESISLEEHLHQILGSSEWDPRPTLLYFHHDHDHDVDEEEGEKLSAQGKLSLKQCKSLDDEKVARWSQLYRFVEVNVPTSEKELLARFKAGDGPSFTVINQDLEVTASTGTIGNAKGVVTFLKSTVKKHFPDYWKTIAERLDAQKKALSDARSLEKSKKYTEALDRVREITSSQLRIGPQYDDAVDLGSKIRKKID